MPAPQSHPGFNNQTSFDPFLAPNDSDENLVAVRSEYTPSHRSHYSPTPERVLKSNDGRSTRAASEALHGPQSHGELGSGYQTSPPPDSHVSNEEWNDPYTFLSPNAYISDNGYNASSERTATPENEPFCLGLEFGVLDDLNQQPGLSACLQPGLNGATSMFQEQIVPNTARPHRYSIGTATKSSSQLMSPELTDAAGTDTREPTSSPPIHHHQLKTEPGLSAQGHSINQVPEYHQTPPMTESSKNTSPDLYNSGPIFPRAASPLILVDQYARGDSPARQAPANTKAKRNRGGSFSSLLSVQATAGGEEDDEERFEHRTPHDPISRGQVRDISVPNLKDQDETSQRAFKNADVADWLDRNDPVSAPDPNLPPERPSDVGKRRRARSAGAHRLSKANLESLQTTPVDAQVPGPGLLIDVSSGEEESECEEGTASIGGSPLPSPTEGMNDIPGEARPGVYDELPNQPALYRAKLWQDPLYDSSDPGVKMQPVSSNDAIMRFQQRAADIETISRVATWGTRRRSESDMASIFRRFTLTSVKEDESVTEETKKRDRSGSIFQRLVPRRGSTVRRKENDKQKQAAGIKPPFDEHSRTSSTSSRHDSLSVPRPVSTSIKRMGSLTKRPKSPKLDTSGAFAAMANPLVAVGTSGQFNAEVSSPTGPFSAAKNVIKRSRSRSDLNNSNASAGGSNLAGLWTQQGGPPMPGLVAPKAEEPSQVTGDDEDEDENDDADGPGIKIDLTIKFDPIVPTLDGFRDNVRQLNPRLPHYLVDRIGQEQLRRYKKLLDLKVKHAGSIRNKKCPSRKFCTELGGEPTYLEGKSKKEAEVAQPGFSVSGINPSDEEVNALAEGIVATTQFPPGVPLPPSKRLPAEFECSLCFKVKKFHKPSDWSKHVHEDVQPFTCTFLPCTDPKSFKRKADWVRHENERHRQLERWECSMNDCSHRCFRKDNFVQHLVREHKLPEPKGKTMKAGKPAVRGPSTQKTRNAKPTDEGSTSDDELDQVWRLVETCRFETGKNAKDEPCKFCGNICTTWKKLTVHLAKHMEQISMPVLNIVKEKNVTPDTIISPIEYSRITSQTARMSPVDAIDVQPRFPPAGATLPGGFTTVPSQAGYLPEPQPQRAPSYTYPPPPQQHQSATAYAPERCGHPNYVPETARFSNSPSPFDAANDPRVFGTQATSSPENMYSMQTPTSQRRTSPYQHPGLQYMQPQPAFAASPEEGSMYPFGVATSTKISPQQTPSTSYAQHSTPAPIYAQDTGQMETSPEQMFQPPQMQNQISAQNMGYTGHQLQGFNDVSDVGYAEPTRLQYYHQ